MRQDFELGALRALTLVAEEQSMSAVSERLGISQQAVSLRIRQLERQLGVRLLNRSARGSTPTPAGELVVGWAAGLLSAADEFARAVDTLRADRAVTARVAASLTVAEYFLPDWIARWRDELGDACPVVQLTAENSGAVIDAVRDGSADLGFIEAPVVPHDLSSVTVAHDRVELVVQHDHPWAGRAAVSAREVARTPLVLRELGSGTREAFESALAEAGHPRSADPAAVLSTTLEVRSALIGGVAPGALSSLAVAEDVRAGRLVRVRIRGVRIVRPLTAIWAGRTLARHVRPLLTPTPPRS